MNATQRDNRLPPGQYSIQHIRVIDRKALKSPARSMFPASQFSGESGAGSDRIATIARQEDCKVHAGDHSFFKISRHISPVYMK